MSWLRSSDGGHLIEASMTARVCLLFRTACRMHAHDACRYQRMRTSCRKQGWRSRGASPCKTSRATRAFQIAPRRYSSQSLRYHHSQHQPNISSPVLHIIKDMLMLTCKCACFAESRAAAGNTGAICAPQRQAAAAPEPSTSTGAGASAVAKEWGVSISWSDSRGSES